MSKIIVVFCFIFILKFDALPSQEVFESKSEAEDGSENEFRTPSGHNENSLTRLNVCRVPTRKSNLLSRLMNFVFRTKSISPSLLDAKINEQNSEEMIIANANKLSPELRAAYVANFYKNRLKKKDDVIEMMDNIIAKQDGVIAKKDGTVAMIDPRMAPFLFFVSTCVIREQLNKAYAESSRNFNASQLPAESCSTKPIKVPPEEVRDQIYDKSVEKWLFDAYPKWLSFVTYDQSSLAKCFREKLNEKSYSYHQMAWSGPKVWKFYNRYSHRNDSSAVVTLQRYLMIRSMALANKDDITEERNLWFITVQDCRMINIFRACNNRPEFGCLSLKNSAELVVPISHKGAEGIWNEKCYVYI